MNKNKGFKVTLSNDKNSRFYRETVKKELENTPLEVLLEKCWGLDGDIVESYVDAFTSLINEGIVEDLLTAKSIVNYDRYFNRYEYVSSYLDLSAELVSDDCLWEDVDTDTDEFYQFLLKEENELLLEVELLNQGWYLCDDVAIGLDNNDI